MRRFTIFLAVLIVSYTGIYAQTYADVVTKFNEGADFINKGDYATAIEYLNEVLVMSETLGDSATELAEKAKGQIPLLNYQEAIKYMKKKDYENAIPFLEKTADLSDLYGNNEEYKAKAMKYLPTLLTGIGTKKLKAEDNAEALKMFEHAIKYAPNYPKAYLGKGMVFKADYEEDKMIEAFTKAIELGKAKNDTKTVKDAQTALGSYFAEQGNLELEEMDPEMDDFSYAIESFEKALTYNPADPDAAYKLTVIYNRMVEYDKAIEYGKKALETAVDEVKIAAINFELGNAYFGTAEYDLACDAYNKAMVDVFEERAIAKKGKVPGCN